MAAPMVVAAPTVVLSLASVPGQRQYGVDQPILGRLAAGLRHPAGGAAVGPLRHPRVGAGLAVTLHRRLAGPGPLAPRLLGPDVTAAVESVAPALVFLDPPGGTWPIATAAGAGPGSPTEPGSSAEAGEDLVAAVVIGGAPLSATTGRRPSNPLGDLRLAGCLLYRNGELVGTGAGGALLGAPVDALVRLAELAGRRGWSLEPGQPLVLSSMVPEIPVTPGDRVTLRVAGFAPVTSVLAASREGGETND